MVLKNLDQTLFLGTAAKISLTKLSRLFHHGFLIISREIEVNLSPKSRLNQKQNLAVSPFVEILYEGLVTNKLKGKRLSSFRSWKAHGTLLYCFRYREDHIWRKRQRNYGTIGKNFRVYRMIDYCLIFKKYAESIIFSQFQLHNGKVLLENASFSKRFSNFCISLTCIFVWISHNFLGKWSSSNFTSNTKWIEANWLTSHKKLINCFNLLSIRSEIWQHLLNNP